MRSRVQWFLGGALVFALILGTAGRSFAAQEWNVTGSGAISLVPGGDTATIRLNAVVVNGSAPDTVYPATGSLSFTLQNGSNTAIRATIRGGAIFKGGPFSPDAALLYGTYLQTSGRVVTDSGPFTLILLEGMAPTAGMAIWLDQTILPADLNDASDPDFAGYMASGRIRIFSQDQQGGNQQ